jgi:hypothetical protein
MLKPELAAERLKQFRREGDQWIDQTLVAFNKSSQPVRETARLLIKRRG